MNLNLNDLHIWIDRLDDEDKAFLKRFALASGSLKAVAAEYGISYPTVRLRLDRLIEKIRIYDDRDIRSEFERELRARYAEGKIDMQTQEACGHRRELGNEARAMDRSSVRARGRGAHGQNVGRGGHTQGATPRRPQTQRAPAHRGSNDRATTVSLWTLDTPGITRRCALRVSRAIPRRTRHGPSRDVDLVRQRALFLAQLRPPGQCRA